MAQQNPAGKTVSKTALFIGRFQPFHQGHLDALKQILNECDEVIVAIGSSQYSNTAENPFSFGERKRIIDTVLRAEGITSYRIAKVDDIHDDAQWVDHLKRLVGDFQAVYTGNETVACLFAEKGYSVKKQRFTIPISAVEERRFIVLDDPRWKQYLHPKAIEVLQQIDGFQRIKQGRTKNKQD